MKAKLSVLAAVIVTAGLHAEVAAAASSPGIATGGVEHHDFERRSARDG